MAAGECTETSHVDISVEDVGNVSSSASFADSFRCFDVSVPLFVGLGLEEIHVLFSFVQNALPQDRQAGG